MADNLRRRRQGVRFDDDDEDYDAVKQGSDDDEVRCRPTAAKVFAARKSLGYDASSDDEDTTPAAPAPKWAERVVAVVDADAAAEGCDRNAAAAWLAECVEAYVGRCEAAADEAEAVLGDKMPSHIDFAPPPEPPKEQRSRAGSEATA